MVGRAFFAAAVLLTACGSQSTPSPSLPSLASTPPALRGIATAYLDLVGSSNSATCAFNVVLSQSAPALPDLRRASAEYAKSLATLAAGLRAIAWAPEIAADANALLDALAADEAAARAMADADSMTSFITADDQLIAADASSARAATELRSDLGLGAAGNPCAH